MTDETRTALARSRHRRYLMLVGAVSVLGFVAAIVIGVIAGGDGDSGDSAWLTALVIGIPLLIMLLVIGGFYLAARRGVWWLQASPAWALSWADRRRVVKAVREGRHLSGFEEQVAQDVARRMALQLWIFPVLMLIWLFNFVTALLEGGPGRIALWAAILVASSVAAVFAWRDVRRGRRFLANAGQEPMGE